MIVRFAWPDRPWAEPSGARHRCDAFWVECPLDDVDARVIARAPAERRESLARDVEALVALARAKVVGLDAARAREELEAGELLPQEREWRRHGEGPRPWVCFLVARDLSRVEAHPWHFPHGSLWNGASPFRVLAERAVDSLDALRDLPAA